MPNQRHNLTQRLSEIGRRLGTSWVIREEGVVRLADHVKVDVRRFIELVEDGEDDQAELLLKAGRFVEKLKPTTPRALQEKLKPMMIAYEQAMGELRQRQLRPHLLSSAARKMVREQARVVVQLPVIPQLASVKRVADVWKPLSEAPLPWRDEGVHRDHDKLLLTSAITRHLFDGREESGTRRFFVCGNAGSGKSLLARVYFLQLVKMFTQDCHTAGPKFVPLRVDVRHEMRRGDEFGTNAWLSELLSRLEINPPLRPIFVFEHIDALLAAHADDPDALDEVMRWPIFTEVDAVFACQRPFFARHLEGRGLDARTATLKPWPPDLQLRYTAEVLGEPLRDQLEDWLAEDPVRTEITQVPLHLVLVTMSLANGASLGDIRQERDLFTEVAKLRLRRDVVDDNEFEKRLSMLGALAHSFYDETRAAALRPIEFSSARLRTWLRDRAVAGKALAGRVDVLENHTLLQRDAANDHVAFESASWGWYFVAFHIAEVLERKPEDTLQVFSKFLTTDVTNFLVGMLRDAVDHDPERARRAMQAALTAPADGTLDNYRRRIAREQLAYFLGSMNEPAVVDLLEPMLESEEDNWVRRGIAFGLADGNHPGFADRYVAGLRTELETGGPKPQSDTNIGFYLTFRGDQPLVVDQIDVISSDPSCTQTMTELVRGLCEVRHAGSWRIKLWTLLDLGRHREISASSYVSALEPHHEALRSIAAKLAVHPEAQAWQERIELDTLIANLPVLGERCST